MAAVFRAQFVYEAQQDDELTLQPGDQVHVLKNDNDDWWTVENVETGKKGLVPTNFLQPVSSTNGSGKKKNEAPILAKVINEYQPQNSDELALWVNGIVTVLDQSVGEGWWKGDLNGKVGIFPSNHVKLVDEAESADTATADTKPSKSPFKLAAYGVKQGGIGSILAGGMHLRKKSGGPSRTSIAEEEHQPHAAPPPILQEQKPTTSSDNKPTSSETTTHKKGMVVHDYEPENADELKLMRGEYVTITDKMDDDGWWAGTNETGLSGVFPSNFVQVLEDQRPPPRRTRPPTIKTDTSTTANPSNNENPLSPNSMAKPPPVPVSTRPTTLITNRTSEASSHSNTAPTPAARPVTSPPLPTRRPPSSAGSGPEPPKRTHKPRQPSIPLVSPDLPPITSKSHERPTSSTTDQTAPTRPSRPVPSPVDGGNTTSPRSSTVERRSVDINDHNRPPMPMAKPPKMFGTKQPGTAVPPPRSSSTTTAPTGPRPTSQAAPPPASVVTPPPRQLSLPGEASLSEAAPLSPPPMPRRSMPMPPPPTATSSTARHNESSEEDDEVDTNHLDPKISVLVRREIDKIRHEFETLLEIERNERQRLEQEIQLLKQRK